MNMKNTAGFLLALSLTVLLLFCCSLIACAQQNGAPGPGEDGHDGHSHDSTVTGDSNSAHEGSGLDSSHPDNCETCKDYWSEPWRKPKYFITVLNTKSRHLLIFLVLCYIYLKRSSIYRLIEKMRKKRS
jgi:hypothetical protein